MISILIPIYNYNVASLIEELHGQLEFSKLEYEIVCIDDGSDIFLDKNKEIEKFENVTYKYFKNNIGRSKIRNLLAQNAKYNWLLFLDADVIPVEKNFIRNYVEAVNSNFGCVFFGGIKNPTHIYDSEKLLRWKYGKARENIKVEVRKKNPNRYFLSSNFLIRKEVFSKIQFDERIEKYGFEDFLFGEELKNLGEKIIQLENLVFHNGIETNSVFLRKTKESLENLHFLKEQKFNHIENIKILSFFKKMDSLNLTKFLSKFFIFFEGTFESNLKGKYPSLVVYDTYKLCYFCHLQQDN